MSKIHQLDPKTLTPSPLLAGIWMLNTIGLEHTDLEYAAGAGSVAANGVQVPVIVIEGTNIIADGRHRHQWAMDAGLPTLPVIYVPEADAMAIIQRETFARRSMSRGQKAWAYLCLHPHLAAGKSGRKELAEESDIDVRKTLEDGAEAAGVSRSLMKEAAALYRLLTHDKRFTKAKTAEAARHDVELRIWQGDGLGQIITDLREGPNAKKTPNTEPVDPNTEWERAAEEASATYGGILTSLETELHTLKSWSSLRPLALDTHANGFLNLSGEMAVQAIRCPDLTASQKANLRARVAELLTDLDAALKTQGVKVK